MAIALVLAGCTGAAMSGGHEHAYEGTELDGAAPDFRLVDQNGETLALSDLRGRVVALAFLDPNCADICPLTASYFRMTHEALGEDASRAAFLAVNVNPDAGDTADTLEATERWSMEAVPSWHFLTGSQEELEQVWAAYNVHGGVPKPGHHDQVQHTPGVYVIDPEGQQYRYVSVGFEDATPLDELLLGHMRALSD